MTNHEMKQEISAFLSTSSKHMEMFNALLADQDAKLLNQDARIFNLENQLTWLKQQIKLGQQRQFGRSTETLDGLQQLPFIFNEDEHEVIDVKSVDEKTGTAEGSRHKVKQCGRKLDMSKLLRERQIHDLPEADKTCACGCRLEKIGEDISEQIDHIKEQLKVIEHVQPKYTCRQCDTIKSAKKPESPLPKSMATTRLITEVILKKYQAHLPLYRQAKLWSAQGFEIPDNTLGNWVMGAAEALLPLRDAFYQQFAQVHVLQADETPVTVLKPHKEGYLWAYHSCGAGKRFILFDFKLTRGGDHPTQLLKDFKGLLQTDGYSGYNGLRRKDGVIPFGCWDHARRSTPRKVRNNLKVKVLPPKLAQSMEYRVLSL